MFADFGGATGVARVMTGPGKVQKFMEQEPRKVAAYVWECLEYRRTEAPDLIPYVSRQELEQLGLADSYPIDTFSSDYDEYFDELGIMCYASGTVEPGFPATAAPWD